MSEKIAFFDMDGTILGNYDHQSGEGSTSWSQLAKAIGQGAIEEKKEINEEWYDNEIETYPRWVEKTLKAYRKRGLNKQIFESVIDNAEYNTGVKEAFNLINQHDIKTVILTGGFNRSARSIKEDLNIDHFVAACEILWDDNGEMCGKNVIPLNRQGKRRMMEMYVDMFSKNDGVKTTYVGDGLNDLEAVRYADYGMSYNGHDDLKSVSDKSYDGKEGSQFSEVGREIVSFLDS